MVALPILQRVDPGKDKQVKISIAGDISTLPTSQETIFFFNVLGVPPKTVGNELKASIQSQLKVFYRPKALPKYKEMGWTEEMTVEKTRGGLLLHNPSPYHIIIYGFTSKGESKITTKDIILKPFSSENVQVKLSGNIVNIFIVNDFGGGSRLSYDCINNSCTLIQR